MTIATAAKQILVDNMDICVAVGLESISKVVGSGKMFVEPDRELLEMHPHIYMPMIGTAEVVAKRYGISRDAQDEYSFQSQQRTAAAQAAGKFTDCRLIDFGGARYVGDESGGRRRYFYDFDLTMVDRLEEQLKKERDTHAKKTSSHGGYRHMRRTRRRRPGSKRRSM